MGSPESVGSNPRNSQEGMDDLFRADIEDTQYLSQSVGRLTQTSYKPQIAKHSAYIIGSVAVTILFPPLIIFAAPTISYNATKLGIALSNQNKLDKSKLDTVSDNVSSVASSVLPSSSGSSIAPQSASSSSKPRREQAITVNLMTKGSHPVSFRLDEKQMNEILKIRPKEYLEPGLDITSMDRTAKLNHYVAYVFNKHNQVYAETWKELENLKKR